MTPWQIIEEALAHKKPPRKAQWLGEKLGVTAQVLTNWKARQVPPARFREIAEALDLTLDQLEGLAPLPWERPPVVWPFKTIPFKVFDDLPERDKGIAEERLRTAIQDLTSQKDLQAAFLDVMQKEARPYFPKPKFRKTSNGR